MDPGLYHHLSHRRGISRTQVLGRISESDDWALGSRQLTLPYLVPSVVATWICAGAIMGAAGWGYLFGFQGTIFDPWGPFLTMILIAIFFSVRVRKLGYTTMVDFFNSRYGHRMGFLYMLIQVLACVGWLGTAGGPRHHRPPDHRL